ncbi:glycine betaine ABC transporter substrate-binding protein [Tropicimonas sp. TH_r6]|uniref:glycine betaine ABC transporter substrate-binding protein n=1 Tax=Tropicimonas sp. TH_r6 TaxID=3082085 RepID=UPI0029549FB4|nr:glycine betaine ABC transporter substrate-binding protein [Tropicimonas sp. TH_r6]MDV7144138.1 glycine betaine ABC transporter substrate-binding protein [Tropicimonas sp. TH_r6]
MISKSFSRRGFLGLTAGGAAGLLSSGPALASSLSAPDVIIGWTPWSDAEVVTKLAARVLRRDMDKDVELTLADISAQFRTIAKGDVDVMLMSWEPGLHANYLRRYGDDLVDLGEIYEGNIGLAVPEWVPEDLISSIEDLAKPEVQEALGGRIVGIDPGAGLMATTRQAMQDYGLGAYELEEGTGPKMVREIAKAQRNETPVVVTAWRPHMKFELYGMRYIEDPKGLYADISSIHARANRNFPDRAPGIAEMLSAIHLEISDIEQIMVAGRQDGIDVAIDAWIAANRDVVSGWLP